MTRDELVKFIDCVDVRGRPPKVHARERKNLEFKADFSANALAKCLKTIAAFASANGGVVCFGISDKPRQAIGTDGDLDEATVQDQLFSHLYPVPDFQLLEHEVFGRRLGSTLINSCLRA